jgi:hypothetical protein
MEIAWRLPTERTVAFNLRYMSETGGKEETKTREHQAPRKFSFLYISYFSAFDIRQNK